LEAAAYLYREAQKAKKQGRYLFARATGRAPALPEWSPAALTEAFRPLDRGELEAAQVEVQRARQAAVEIVTWQERDFPVNLQRSLCPPAVLYVKGQLSPRDRAAIAVVGARRASKEYREIAADLAYGLAKEGFTVVSGLARGIDRAAHEGALEAGGRTLAVLGSGVDVVYPPEHAALAKTIAENGAVLSFFPMGCRPAAFRFPARNWVIAGLCLAVVVVQAADESGALITANAAACMGREVMAVPGPPGNAMYEGSNGLIRDGAKLVMSAPDVLKALRETLENHGLAAGPQGQGSKSAAKPSAGGALIPGFERPPVLTDLSQGGWPSLDAILGALVDGPRSVEDLAEQCGVDVGEAQAALTRLEIEGRVAQVESGRWRLTARRWS